VTAASGRVLFLLHEPGYFRLYGSTIVELSHRGWEVLLAFDKPERRGNTPLVPAGAQAGVHFVGATPPVGSEARLASLRAALDYLRYLEPQFAAATFLRQRAARRLPPALHWLQRLSRAPRWAVGAAIRCMRAIERAVPADPRMREFLHSQAPDVVFISPVVTLGPSGGTQTEAVKAARALGLPTVVGAASWDHLTSTGLIRIVPDVVSVWNHAQRAEAVDLHRIPPSRVRLTGAQSLDHWFEPRPPEAAHQFRARLGLPPGSSVILYVGSSKNMAPGDREPRFVERWLTALRASSAPALRGARVIVRPHPANTEPWTGDALAALQRQGVTVWPLSYSGMPLSDAEIEEFHDTLLACDAVVGVNTTAMIEAAIVGRPVLTVRDAAFTHSQRETLHFQHLVADREGCALVARSLDEHIAQLERTVTHPGERSEILAAFVGTFVRPFGLDDRATDRLCDVIEDVAQHVSPSHVDAGLAHTALANGRRRS
jgi:hypothetical protein